VRSIELELPGGPATVTVVELGDAARDVLEAADRLLRGYRPTAFDVETTGLEVGVDRLRMVQLGTADEAIVVPARYAPAIELARLARPIAHNGLFDCRWLSTVGVSVDAVVARMIDTQTLAHLIDPRPAELERDDDDELDAGDPVGLGLKDLAVRYLGAGADRYERELYAAHGLPPSGRGVVWQRGWAAIDDDDPYLIAYAASDTVLTARLHLELEQRLTERERDELVPIEQRITLEAWKIIARGLDVDTDSAASVRDGLLSERERLEVALEPLGVANPDSSRQCATALTAAGAPLTARTSTGLLSTNRVVLEGLAEHASGPAAELARLIRDGRRTKAYATKYAGKLATSSGIVHPFVRVTGARTGRWSMADPRVQQWPKQALRTPSSSYDLRALLRAPGGQVLIACDLSSIETVVGAAVCGDANMRRAVDQPLGTKLRIYDDLAAQLGISRAIAKVLVLSGIYGVGNAKLAVLLGTDDLHAVKRLRADTFGGYWCSSSSCPIVNTDPMGVCDGHAEWSDGFYGGPRRMRAELARGQRAGVEQRDGWPGIRNLYGRWVPARMRGGQPDWFPTFNHAVQGSARDLLMGMLLEVADRGLTPWLTVHDEVIVVADRADAGDARRVLLDIMQTERHPVLELPVHAEAGMPAVRWGNGGGPIT